MTDNLYLLTEAEIAHLIRKAHVGGTFLECLATVQPLSPDWTKAPAWATHARHMIKCGWGKIDEEGDCVRGEILDTQYLPWIPRPAKGDSNAP